MAKLTSKERNNLPTKDFAGPDRSYPIQNRGHAKAALARVSEWGSQGTKEKVRAAVHRKYPDLKGK